MSGPKPTLPGERRTQKDQAIYQERNQKIRERYAAGGEGNSYAALGHDFGLTKGRIHQIVKGRRRYW